MKLFLHCQSLSAGKGGTERVATELAEEMANRGHLVYLCYKNNGPPAYSVSENINLIPFDSFKELREVVKDKSPDVFFSFYVNHLLIKYYSVVHQLNIPFGIQECSNPIRVIENNWARKGTKKEISIFRSNWEREIIASAAHCVRLTMDSYIQSFPDYIKPRVKAFSNPSCPQDLIAAPGRNDAQKVIINIGGMKRNKNLLCLIDSFAPLAHKFPDWIIKIYGKINTNNVNKSYIDEVYKRINSYNLNKQIQICGPSEDIFEKFINSHIHAITSLSEGCPTCVLEAMATGVPSIGFDDCSGTNELIKNGKNGLLVLHTDRVNNFSHALRKLMVSAELREEMGKKAWKDSKSFAPKRIYDQWEQLFYEAAEYKSDPNRLFRQQMDINPEKALHARRMREKLIREIK